MPGRIRIRVDFPDSIGRMQNAQPIVRDVLRRRMRQSVLWFARDVEINTPVDRGFTKASTASSVRGGVSGTVQGVVSQGGAARYLEDGTPPHFPPVAELERWAQRVIGQRGLGFVIARSIAKRGTSMNAMRRLGTRGYRMFARALEKNEGRIREHLRDGAREFARRIEGR